MSMGRVFWSVDRDCLRGIDVLECRAYNRRIQRASRRQPNTPRVLARRPLVALLPDKHNKEGKVMRETRFYWMLEGSRCQRVVFHLKAPSTTIERNICLDEEDLLIGKWKIVEGGRTGFIYAQSKEYVIGHLTRLRGTKEPVIWDDEFEEYTADEMLQVLTGVDSYRHFYGVPDNE